MFPSLPLWLCIPSVLPVCTFKASSEEPSLEFFPGAFPSPPEPQGLPSLLLYPHGTLHLSAFLISTLAGVPLLRLLALKGRALSCLSQTPQWPAQGPEHSRRPIWVCPTPPWPQVQTPEGQWALQLWNACMCWMHAEKVRQSVSSGGEGSDLQLPGGIRRRRARGAPRRSRWINSWLQDSGWLTPAQRQPSCLPSCLRG